MLDNFIDKKIKSFLNNNKNERIITRFPPEPNGFLHIGHVKSICLNFFLAEKYKGFCLLRFDNTNPKKEKNIYVDAIKKDIKWLGFTCDRISYASDYFDKLESFALTLIQNGDAYVCELNHHQIKQYRGTLKIRGKNSPYRNRSIEENLLLFRDMQNGLFKEGDCVLRAKIDMSSSNINMRDPIIYRILSHKINGNIVSKIYPMYDFAHSLCDAIEGITHSICTLEFEDHRPLYNWFIKKVFNAYKSMQIEFSRLNISNLITSKRIIKYLVDHGIIEGWDDPRIATISGMRNRGFTPEGIKNFCYSLGVSKSESLIKIELLEKYVREDLDNISVRRMAVINPLLIEIINLKKEEDVYGMNHPKNKNLGSRKLKFSRYIYIEKSDFCEKPNKEYKRLTLSNKVRLRYGYVIECKKIIKDKNNNIVKLECIYDKNTLNKKPESYKVSGVIHWVSQKYSKKTDIIYYNNLFLKENLKDVKDMKNLMSYINYKSKEIYSNSLIEPNIEYSEKIRYQFERVGYFILDEKNSIKNCKFLFKRILSLKNEKKF